MDPGTLTPLARLQPRSRFAAPRAVREEVLRRTGVSEGRMILLDAGETVSPLPGIRIVALRAAHETLERDPNGCFRFLGYGLAIAAGGKPPVTLIHTGDTVPFEGQSEEIARLSPDLLLLPVNGRSPALAARGIAGNLTLDEAVELTAGTGAAAMIAHHHGMFAFNTLPLSTIDAKVADAALPFQLLPARLGLEVRLEPA
jgi:L-ascorbate metabolism protein UlaG (beta-lactamase superfamily)